MPSSPLPRVIALSVGLVCAAVLVSYVGLGGALASGDVAGALDGLPDASRQQAKGLHWDARLKPWDGSEYMRLGMFFLANNRPGAAIEWLHRATVWSSAEYEPWYYLGLAEKASHNAANAEIAFHKVLRLNPDYAAARYQLASLLLDEGRAPEAVEAFTELSSSGHVDKARVAEALGRALLRTGDNAGAARAFAAAIAKFPSYGDAHAGLSFALRALGDELRAAREARLATNTRAIVPLRIDDPLIERMEQDFPTGLSLFQAAARNHDFHVGIGTMEQALQLDPSMTFGWEYLISLYGAAHRLSDAEKAWGELEKLDTGNTRGRYELAVALGQNGGDRTRAVALLNQALKFDPAFSEAHRALGVLAQKDGNNDEAARQYRAAIEGDPSLAEAYVDLGMLLLKTGDFKGGQAELLRALVPPCEQPERILAREIVILRDSPAEAAWEQAVRAQATARNQISLIAFLNGRKKPEQAQAPVRAADRLLVPPSQPRP